MAVLLSKHIADTAVLASVIFAISSEEARGLISELEYLLPVLGPLLGVFRKVLLEC